MNFKNLFYCSNIIKKNKILIIDVIKYDLFRFNFLITKKKKKKKKKK